MGVNPAALTMTSRDVIISYHDDSANITHYLQVNPDDNSTVLATEVPLHCLVHWYMFLFNFILIEYGQCYHFSNGYKSSHAE